MQVVLTYELTTLDITCHKCTRPVKINRKNVVDPHSSGVFCRGCNSHYWVNWKEGWLHLDGADIPVDAQKIRIIQTWPEGEGGRAQ